MKTCLNCGDPTDSPNRICEYCIVVFGVAVGDTVETRIRSGFETDFDRIMNMKEESDDGT